MKKIQILDVGCRYGIFDIFKKFSTKLEFHMVDMDKLEISRLKKKYKKLKNMYFYSACLGERNTIVDFSVFNHQGYNSVAKLNKKAFWFKQQSQKKIKLKKKFKIKQIKSTDFLKINKVSPEIIKLDIEGGELNFLNGLDDRIKKIKALILETEFENTYSTKSNFGSIHNFMISKNFTLVKLLNYKTTKLNIFSNSNDGIPGVCDSVYINNDMLKSKTSEEYNLNLNILLLLELDQILFFKIEKFKSKFKINKKNNLYNDLKIKIAKVLNTISKEPFYSYKEANNLFCKIFNISLPSFNKFNENNFFNKD